MPYVSKEDRERERWLTLPELVALIQAADRCSFDVACEQVRKALRDAAIWPLHWEPEPHPPPSRRLRIPGSPPPGRDDHWLNIKFDWERGRVFDDFERAAYPALRKLWREEEGPMIGSDDGYSSRARPPDPPKPRRSVWRMLFLDRPACEAIWSPREEAVSVGNPDHQPALETPAPTGTVAYAKVKGFLETHGQETEGRLLEAAQKRFPNKRIPRQHVRNAITELWGSPGREGRPKVAKKKSP